MVDPANCEHKNINVPYDPVEAKNMTAEEIKLKFPRFWGNCPDCGQPMIAYASFEHYIAGDW